MSTYIIMKQILSLFLIVVLGFYGRKKNIIDGTITNGLTKLLTDISVPLLIISSFSFTYSSSIASNITKAFIYGLAIFIVTPILAKLLLIKAEKKKTILQFAVVFSNCGFMGFPIAESVLGHEGVIYASIFNMFYNLFVWTYGVMLFTEVRNLKEIKNVFKNPAIIAVFIGLFVMMFSIKIPDFLLDTMKLVGGLTTPVSMLIIGSLLATANFKQSIRDISIYYISFIRLLIIPLAVYLVSFLFQEKSTVIKSYILMQAMPVGTMTSLFAEKFNREKEFSAFIISFSTLLSVITIPLIIKFFL